MPKRIMPLDHLTISGANPKGKEYKLSDGGGLYLLVTPSGGKLWRLKYRFGGLEKKLALGAFPETSLSLARQKREEARGQIAQGIDPGAAKKEQTVAKLQERETFETLAREWHGRYSSQWEQGTAKKLLAHLEGDVFPVIGAIPVAEIKAQTLLAMLRRIEARGAAYTAHRVRGVCGQVLRYAVATGQPPRIPWKLPPCCGCLTAIRVFP
jgi:hypothetical protein